MLHQLRESDNNMPELDLVAEIDRQLWGHIIASQAHVIAGDGQKEEILSLGPISVLPSHQNQGVGSELLKKAIIVARRIGNSGIILFTNPDYYHRFGFTNAHEYGITTKD